MCCRVRKCCCCSNLDKGVIALAVIGIILGIILLILAFFYDIGFSLTLSIGSTTIRIGKFVIAGDFLLTSLLLLIGVFSKQSILILASMIISMISLLILMVNIIIMIIGNIMHWSPSNGLSDFLVKIGILLFTALCFYFWAVVYSLFRNLRESQSKEHQNQQGNQFDLEDGRNVE